MFSRQYLVFQLSSASHFKSNLSQEMQFFYFYSIACVLASDIQKRHTSALADPVYDRSVKYTDTTDELSETLTGAEKSMFYDWAVDSMIEDVTTVVIRAASTIEPPSTVLRHLERALLLAEALRDINREPEDVFRSIKKILPQGALTLSMTQNFKKNLMWIAGMPAWIFRFLTTHGTSFDAENRSRLAVFIRSITTVPPAFEATYGSILDRWIRIWGTYCIVPSRSLAEGDPRPCVFVPQIPGSPIRGKWRLTDLSFRKMIADEMADVKKIVSGALETPEALNGSMMLDDPVIIASASSESLENSKAQAVVVETETSLTTEGQTTQPPRKPTRKRSSDEISGNKGTKSSPAKTNKGGIYDAYERVMANPSASVNELVGEAADKYYEKKLRKNIEWLFFLGTMRSDFSHYLVKIASAEPTFTPKDIADMFKRKTRESPNDWSRGIPLELWIKYCLYRTRFSVINTCTDVIPDTSSTQPYQIYRMSKATWIGMLKTEGRQRFHQSLFGKRFG